MSKEKDIYRKCKYNTSKAANFVGYCDLPKYHTERGMMLVYCKGDSCEEMVLNEENEEADYYYTR